MSSASTPRLANITSCRVQSQLLTAAHVQRLQENVYFNPPSCRCQRASLRCTSCELEASLSNCQVALDGFTRPDWHLVVSLWSAPECAPAVTLRAQQFVQLADARVPFHAYKHALLIVVGHQRVMEMFQHASPVHVHVVVLSYRSCQSSLARALLPASCRSFSCSGARRTRTVHLLFG